MPYIKSEDRAKYEKMFRELSLVSIASPGDLNYLFTVIINHYIIRHGISYQKINDVIGALEACKQEFYRRDVASYEDKKLKENGDV